MLFSYFILPVLFALSITITYLWRSAYRHTKQYPWPFRIFYGLVLVGGVVVAFVRLGGALRLGWTFADPWLLVVAAGWLLILVVAMKDWLRPIHSLYVAYMVPFLAIMIAGLSAVKPDGLGTLAVLGVLSLLLLWVSAIKFAARKTRSLRRWVTVAAMHVLLVAAFVGWIGFVQQQSMLPQSFSMNMPDDAMTDMHQQHGAMKQVHELRGPKTAERVQRFELEAVATTLKLDSGITTAAWVYRTPEAPSMPVLRVAQGDLVEATLTNRLPVSVTIHWHGVDVPNGEDGVAGVTQDAIKPGEKFTYRFIAADAGTYWFHSHQDSNFQVAKGLFGALIVEPRGGSTSPGNDIPILAHSWAVSGGRRQFALGTHDGIDRRAIAPGAPVRLRLINTDNSPQRFQLISTPYRVLALDGVDVNDGATISDQVITVPSGGRVDLGFTMPRHAVELAYDGERKRSQASIIMSSDGKGESVPPKQGRPVFDIGTYGRPHPHALPANAHFDKTYDLVLDDSFRFYNGRLQFTFPINGKLLPDTPMLMVHEGDLVKISFKNRGTDTHPMHLHGHHFTVLSHNGKATPSRPLLDTLDVAPGESWTIAFRADNPGLWMSHCHNLEHAASGMDLMVAYDNVMTPFSIQVAGGNKPE